MFAESVKEKMHRNKGKKVVYVKVRTPGEGNIFPALKMYVPDIGVRNFTWAMIFPYISARQRKTVKKFAALHGFGELFL